MARTSEISFAQVAQIADTMQAAGHRPTARAIRERIGSGSMGTIHRLLTQWNGKTAKETETPALPDSIGAALMDFVQTEIATACEPIREALEAAREEAAHLAENNETLARDIADLVDERDSLKSAFDQVHGTLEQVTKDRRDLAHRETIQTGLIAQLREQLQRAEDRAAELDQVRAELEALRKAELLAVKEIATATAMLDGFRNQAKTAQEENKALAAQLKTAERAVDAGQARLEAAAREIDQMRQRNDKLTAELIEMKSAQGTPNTEKATRKATRKPSAAITAPGDLIDGNQPANTR